jgi:hypothetical protein
MKKLKELKLLRQMMLSNYHQLKWKQKGLKKL